MAGALAALFPTRLIAACVPKAQPLAVNFGTAGDPAKVTKENVLDMIIECGRILDEQNVPTHGRRIRLPEWAMKEMISCT